MEACVDSLGASGSVLEIGFGLGYSARRLCSSPGVVKYSVVECCPAVWEKVEEFRQDFPEVEIDLIKGRWQDVLYTTGRYDTCFFDDYLPDGTTRNRFISFLTEFLPHHANIGCRVGAYSTEYASGFAWATSLQVECDRYKIDIPPHCKYARGDKTYIIKLTKVSEMTDEDVEMLTEVARPKSNVGKFPSNVKLKAVSRPSQIGHQGEFAEIQDLYFGGRKASQVAEAAESYLERFSIDNHERRMVKFFQACALFHTDPSRSEELFIELLSLEDLAEDVEGWVRANVTALRGRAGTQA